MADMSKFLDLVSENPSDWQDDAKYREKNEDWLVISAKIALKILRKLRADGMSQKELADKMDVSPQYISKIVKGNENLSLETICKLENTLGINLIQVVESKRIIIDIENISSSLAISKTELIQSSSNYKYQEAKFEYIEGDFVFSELDLPLKEIA